MTNIQNIKDCYGCGVCASVCPKNIIEIKLNRNGFYEPTIYDDSLCIQCGICSSVCAFNQKELANNGAKPIKCWAAWSKDERIRRKCSSGGAGFEIGKHLIEQGYKVVGCRYDVRQQRAEHYVSTTVEELVQSIGSKYIQSYTVDAFREIERKKHKYLIIGTPCQIDSFRRMINKFNCEENFILMDFFCHCVPSMFAWKSYIKMLEPKIGEVTYASWRNKFEYGWHDSWLMGIDGSNTSEPIDWHDSYSVLIREKKTSIQSRMSQGDLFYKFFLGDICIGPQCYKDCKYKYDRSSADIRIGDLWGKTYQDNRLGVSALIAFTEKGCDVITQLENILLVEHPFDVVAEGQMKENAIPSRQYKLVMNILRHKWNLSEKTWKRLLYYHGIFHNYMGRLLKMLKID